MSISVQLRTNDWSDTFPTGVVIVLPGREIALNLAEARQLMSFCPPAVRGIWHAFGKPDSLVMAFICGEVSTVYIRTAEGFQYFTISERDLANLAKSVRVVLNPERGNSVVMAHA